MGFFDEHRPGDLRGPANASLLVDDASVSWKWSVLWPQCESFALASSSG